MSVSNIQSKVAYAFNQPLSTIFGSPIVAKRAPTGNDKAPIGTEWAQPVDTSGAPVNGVWFLSSIIGNVANWVNVSGGSGVFTTLTVTGQSTLGPTNITGATNINTSGAATTDIGTGGTGAVNIGNTTGNTAVTGSLSTTTSLSATTTVTAGTGISATTGNIVAAAGNITATLGNIAASAGSVSAATSVTGATLYASGDGGGVASQNALSNVSVAVAGGTGAFSITSTTGSGTGTNAGFIKIYVGTVAMYIPYFTATT